jgi:hypothetical protein
LNGLLAAIGMDFYRIKLRSSKFAMEPCYFTGGITGPGAKREQHLTLYRHQKDPGHEQVFALTSDGNGACD